MTEACIAVCFSGCVFAAGYPFILYPAMLLAFARLCSRPRPPALDRHTPSVTIVVPVHNGEAFIGDKLANLLALDYPADNLQILVASDGSTDATNDIVRQIASPQVRLLALPSHDGKNVALNQAVATCTSELVVVTDVDALLARDALRRLARWFAEPAVGGVVGRKLLHMNGNAMDRSQATYNRYQELIKGAESRLYSTAMNEGKLHALRRRLYKPIPVGCMDDLHNLLSVVSQGYRFHFDPSAQASISIPSADATNEIERRRRIVNGSLKALLQFPGLLNPFAHPRYSWMLWSQKVSRRTAPFFMLAAIATAGGWALHSRAGAWVFGGCSVLPVLALLVHARVVPGLGRGGRIAKLFAVPYYFCLGNFGTMLGVCDLVMGRRNADRWIPRKRREPWPQGKVRASR
ncbi:MAG: glycosyltransferase [Chitinivibrionales bacterium]|nr:glycosyltransferase [Chitinivibrionales bacterium]